MIILNSVNWHDFFYHIQLFGNGIATGALLGIIIYRNITLKWNTKRRWW